MQVLCSAGYGCTGGTGYHGQSRWGANYGKAGHNCTSYVSYRLAELGVAQPWRPMGDAGQWDDNGGAVTSGSTSTRRSAPWRSGRAGTRSPPAASGHVGYVESVDPDGTIEVTDDSYGGGTRRFRISPGSRTGPAASCTSTTWSTIAPPGPRPRSSGASGRRPPRWSRRSTSSPPIRGWNPSSGYIPSRDGIARGAAVPVVRPGDRPPPRSGPSEGVLQAQLPPGRLRGPAAAHRGRPERARAHRHESSPRRARDKIYVLEAAIEDVERDGEAATGSRTWGSPRAGCSQAARPVVRSNIDRRSRRRLRRLGAADNVSYVAYVQNPGEPAILTC